MVARPGVSPAASHRLGASPMGHNGWVAPRGRTGTSGRLALLGLAVGITAAAIAWGVLVLAAIDFGRDARGGDSQGWLFLGVATLGAIACMFLAIIFASRLGQRLRGGRMVRTSSEAAPGHAASPALEAVPASRTMPVTEADDAVRPGDITELGTAPAHSAPATSWAPGDEAPPTEVEPATAAEADPQTETIDAVRPGDAVVLHPLLDPPPVQDTSIALPDVEPDPEPASYHSKHSRASAEPETDESSDSPAASYRGKRAAR